MHRGSCAFRIADSILKLVLLQLLWSLLLWPVARRLWRVSQERMVVYGG